MPSSEDEYSDIDIDIPPEARYSVTHWADAVPNIIRFCVYYIGLDRLPVLCT